MVTCNLAHRQGTLSNTRRSYSDRCDPALGASVVRAVFNHFDQRLEREREELTQIFTSWNRDGFLAEADRGAAARGVNPRDFPSAGAWR